MTIPLIVIAVVMWVWLGVIGGIAEARRDIREYGDKYDGYWVMCVVFGALLGPAAAFTSLMMGLYGWQKKLRKKSSSTPSFIKRKI